MSLLNNCGGLHIRTLLTDTNLSPNTISQLIVKNGLRIGVIPESTVKSQFYTINIRTSLSELIFSSEKIPYIGSGNYIYVTIPFSRIPKKDDVIYIQLISDTNCASLTEYVVTEYIIPPPEEPSTTVTVNGVLEKYIKVKPTITTGGFVAGETYYYKCLSSNQSDNECFLQFKKEQDLSKILDKLPKSNTIQVCPPTLSWNFSDIICITPQSSVAQICNIICTDFKNVSGNIFQVSYSQQNVTSFEWNIYNTTNTSIKNGFLLNPSSTDSFNIDLSDLVDGTYKFVISSTNCVSDSYNATKYFTIATNSIATHQIVNTIPDMEIVPETYWNHFSVDTIPDITIPYRLDNLTNKFIPNKWLFYHSYQGLSKFGSTSIEQVTKLFKRGFTHINIESLPSYAPNIETVINGDNLIGDVISTNDDSNLTQFSDFVTHSFDFASQYHVTKTDNKFNLFANFVTYNGRMSSAQTQESVNYLNTGYYSATQVTNGRFGFINLGYTNNMGYITSNGYTTPNLLGFIGYSDNNVENAYKNKSLKDGTNLLVGFEQTYYYETLLPQNFQVKDQNNSNWFNINHFGGEATNLVGVGQTPNCEHWASQIAGNTQILYNRAKLYNQDVIITVKPTCDRGETYLHSKTNSIYRNGKYIKEWNRYSNKLFDLTQNVEYDSNFETESITNFVAEGQIILAYFSGARGINFVSKYLTKELIAREKVSNLRKGTRYDNVTLGNQNYESYLYTMKAMWRLSQKISVRPNEDYSFFDICDGSEIYVNDETEVSYDNGVNFIKQRALDWQINQTSPILSVVNLEKNIISICALQAYGVEQTTAIVRYIKNGRNFQQSISIPSNKISLYMFDLGQIS